MQRQFFRHAICETQRDARASRRRRRDGAGQDPRDLDVAVAQFEDFQRLREALAEANLRLAERKLVERAKGLLMKHRSLDEQAA